MSTTPAPVREAWHNSPAELIRALHEALMDDDRQRRLTRGQAPRKTKAPKTTTPIPEPQVHPRLTRNEVVEDVEWLLSLREHPTAIARRLDRNPTAIARLLHRAGRHDLAGHFERESNAA